eukprot:TRINITY_DN18285_c0_g4_i1.p1 TRINITY_DN18285_c0_g4~~TRINITY_DN18285_c0_g4_i1.p1  ORF type:complete len:638 (+),score=241.78 TRINITY_DN18285_c0_g4_i1:86-1915(+)
MGWSAQPPFWPQYPTRKLQVMEGEWSFGFWEGGVDIDSVDPRDAALTPNTTQVPSVFDNALPGVQGSRGSAFYRATIQPFSNPGAGGLVSFAACGFFCKVWVDGVLLGNHTSGGYSMFWFELPAGDASKARELFVLADNRFDSERTPLYTGGDFWHFAGLTRSVAVHELPVGDSHLQRVEVVPTSVLGRVDMTFVLTASSSVPSHGCFNVTWHSPRAQTTQHCVPMDTATGTGKVSDLKMPCMADGSCKLWTFDEPNLTNVTIAHYGDAIHTRFGLRILGRAQAATPDGTATRITLNGNIVKLKGYNRHTMYPDTGLSLTLAQHQQDMALIKEVGANIVRGAHYPQDQRWLDLCDENGIAMWEECLGPGVQVANIEDPWFMQNQVVQAHEMVSASINHACVFMWGFFNEAHSEDDRSCPGYATMADTLRSRDTSRFVTWADDKKNASLCLEHTDLVAFNSYPGWYQEDQVPAEFWGEQAAWVGQNYPDKPFMISETGASGVYEWTNSSDVRWSQKYQTNLVTQDVKFALGDARVAAITLWQLTDVKANTNDTVDCPQCDYEAGVDPPICSYIDVSVKRPGGENHKGSVDFWRRKKDVFTAVKQLYTESE